jgi:hypothetical protein
VNPRRDFTRSPFSDRLLEQTLVVGEVEVDQRQLPASGFQFPASGFQLSATSKTGSALLTDPAGQLG